MAAIIFVPGHLTQLLVPYDCITTPGTAGDVMKSLRKAPDVACDVREFGYAIMAGAGLIFGCMLASLFCVITLMVYKAFWWQFGNKARDKIPFYVSLTELSAFGMRG
jgi:hypothetical protein